MNFVIHELLKEAEGLVDLAELLSLLQMRSERFGRK